MLMIFSAVRALMMLALQVGAARLAAATNSAGLGTSGNGGSGEVLTCLAVGRWCGSSL